MDCLHSRGSIPQQPEEFSVRNFCLLGRWTSDITYHHSTRTLLICLCSCLSWQRRTLNVCKGWHRYSLARTFQRLDDTVTSLCDSRLVRIFWRLCTRQSLLRAKWRGNAWFRLQDQVPRNTSMAEFAVFSLLYSYRVFVPLKPALQIQSPVCGPSQWQ